jgi:hypothetical protein
MADKKLKISNPRKQIMGALKEDSDFKKFRKIVKRVEERLKIQEFLSEAKALHAGRTSRKLHERKQFNPRALIEASTKDLSIRSRLVEIRVNVSVNLSNLEEAIDAVKRYISTEFYDALSEYKTVDLKKSLIDRAIARPLDMMSDTKSLIEVLDILIRDIDQSNFHMKTMIEALKLLDDSKGKTI